MRVEPISNGVRIRIKVVPGASRDAIAGWLGDRLKVRVAAPPEGGKANAGLIRLLAQAAGLPPRSVHISSGHGSAEKTVELTGLTLEQAAARLPRD